MDAFFDHRCWIVKHSIWRLDEQYDEEIIPTWYQEWWDRLQIDNLVIPSLIGGGIVTLPGLFDLILLGFT